MLKRNIASGRNQVNGLLVGLTALIVTLCTISTVSAATIDDVYVGTSSGYVYMLNSDLSDTGICFATGDAVTSVTVLPNGNVAVGAGRYVYLRDPDLGQIGGGISFDVGSSLTVESLAAQSDNDVVVGTSDQWVFLTDSSLVEKTNYSVGGGVAITALAVQSDDDVLVGTSNPYVYLTNSSLVEQDYFSASSAINSLAVQSDDDVLVGTSDRWLFLTDSSLGEIANYSAGNGVAITALAVQSIPEPSSFVLLSIGLAACAWRRRRGQA